MAPAEQHIISFIKSARFQMVLTTCCTLQDMYPTGREDGARYQNYSAKNKVSGDSPRSITTNEITNPWQRPGWQYSVLLELFLSTS